MQPTIIFNPNGSDLKEDRFIWGGNSTNLANLNNEKYTWAGEYKRQMDNNFWIPQKYDLTGDVKSYLDLTLAERKAFDGIMSYLTFLDSIQTTNLPKFALFVTAPEVQQTLITQTYQEAIHNQSYQYMIETVIPEQRRNAVYEVWREDRVLLERCEFIVSFYQRMFDNRQDDDYFDALVADYLLEGLYFYVGFMFFYNLASRGLMGGCADIFKLINRDEWLHIKIFQQLILEAQKYSCFSISKDKIYEMVHEAVEKELAWVNHIIGNNVLGMCEASNENYIKYRANNLLVNINLSPIYNGVINSYKHLERASAVGEDAGSAKVNFFEASVTDYKMSTAIGGFDKF